VRLKSGPSIRYIARVSITIDRLPSEPSMGHSLGLSGWFLFDDHVFSIPAMALIWSGEIADQVVF